MIIRKCAFIVAVFSVLLSSSALFASQKPSTAIVLADTSQRVIAEDSEQAVAMNFAYPYTDGKATIRYKLSEGLQKVAGDTVHRLDFKQAPKQFSTELTLIAKPGKHYLTIYIELEDSSSDAVMTEVINLPIQAGAVIALDAKTKDSNLPQGVVLQKSQTGQTEMIVMPAEETIIQH